MAREKKIVIVVIAAKLLILWVFLLQFGYGALIWSDSETYLRLARNIYAGRGFSDAHASKTEFAPNAIRTPLYPAVIGFFDAYVPYGLAAASALQAVAVGFIALLVYKIALRFVGENGALAGAFFVSFEPLVSAMHILIMPETFLLLFLALFLFSFLRHLESRRRAHLVWAALALALAVYTKPVAFYLGVVPLGFLIFQKKSLTRAALFIAMLAVFFLPWMTRNKVALGTFDMIADDTGNICGWELVSVLATKYRIDASDFTTLYALDEYREAKKKCASTADAARLFLIEYPVDFFKTSVLSAASLLTNDGYTVFFAGHGEAQSAHLTPAVLTSRDWREHAARAFFALGVRERFLVLAGKVLWVVVMLCAVLGVWRLVVRGRGPEALFLFLVACYFIVVTVASTGYGVGARLRYPIVPIAAIFALAGASYFWRKEPK